MHSVLVRSHDANLRAAARGALERAGCGVTAAHSGHGMVSLARGDIEVLGVENDLPAARQALRGATSL